MNVTLQVDGLDKLRSLMGAASQNITRETRPAIRDTALEVRERARQKAQQFSVDGFYPASIRHQIESGGLSAVVGSIAKTARSIEEGRRAGEVVPFGLILRWVERKGLGRTFSTSTHKQVRTKNARSAAQRGERDLAARIVAEIKSRGTKPHAHLIPAARESADGLKKRMHDAIGRALRTR